MVYFNFTSIIPVRCCNTAKNFVVTTLPFPLQHSLTRPRSPTHTSLMEEVTPQVLIDRALYQTGAPKLFLTNEGAKKKDVHPRVRCETAGSVNVTAQKIQKTKRTRNVGNCDCDSGKLNKNTFDMQLATLVVNKNNVHTYFTM